jgi:hypothetical protein
VQECSHNNTTHCTRNIHKNGFPNNLIMKITKDNKIPKQILLEGSGDSYGDPEFLDPHGSVENKGLAIPPKPMKRRGAKRIVTSVDAKALKMKDVGAISSEQSRCTDKQRVHTCPKILR